MPLAAFLIPAVSQFLSAALGSRASRRADDRRDAFDREALDFERKQYDDEQARLEPFRRQGSMAYARLAQMLGMPLAPSSQPADTSQTFTFSTQPTQGRPRIGERKTFRNGRTGEWDGRGWQAVN